MGKSRLNDLYEFDFDLIGIVCNRKEFQLAWYLNQELSINLIKQEDIKILFSDNTCILISNFVHKGEFLRIELLQNRLVNGRNMKHQLLIPELKQFDFLLKFRDQTGGFTSENVSGSIRRIPVIEYHIDLNFEQLKSKENLLY